MYDKDTVKNTKTEFYTSFGKFMGKHRSAHGNKVKWVNYNTGIKHLYLRLETDKKSARICIDLQHKDDDIRELFYEQFKALKTVFHEIMETEWVWVEKHINETGFNQCRIYIEINHCPISISPSCIIYINTLKIWIICSIKTSKRIIISISKIKACELIVVTQQKS